MQAVATTKMSSKGQVVIPGQVRKALNLKPGTQFVVLGERGPFGTDTQSDLPRHHLRPRHPRGASMSN